MRLRCSLVGSRTFRNLLRKLRNSGMTWCRTPSVIPETPKALSGIGFTWLLLLPLLLAVSVFTWAQDSGESPDIEYAEAKRLATKSLLLDVLRTPGGRLVAVGERGHVVLSDDGRDWRQAQVVPTRSTLTTVAAAGTRRKCCGCLSCCCCAAAGDESNSAKRASGPALGRSSPATTK